MINDANVEPKSNPVKNSQDALFWWFDLNERSTLSCVYHECFVLSAVNKCAKQTLKFTLIKLFLAVSKEVQIQYKSCGRLTCVGTSPHLWFIDKKTMINDVCQLITNRYMVKKNHLNSTQFPSHQLNIQFYLFFDASLSFYVKFFFF